MKKLEKIHKKGIFFLTFKDRYDLCMHFLRLQEYYESPVYKDSWFTIVEYMDWYSREHGDGTFTYPGDWSGFNVPSKTIRSLYGHNPHYRPDNPSKPGYILDPNNYDRTMWQVKNLIEATHDGEYYLIGCLDEKSSVMKHEIAHALFYLDAEYKEEQSANLREAPKDLVKTISDVLVEMGYHKSVIEDEFQAYMSTGLSEKMNLPEIPQDEVKQCRDKFEETFKKFYKEEG